MIEGKNIVKSFGPLKAVDDVSFRVEDGEVLSIIGSSGSGKSTLLRCINRLETPDSGTIYIDGEPIEEDYIAELTRNKLDFIGPKTVPEGCVFVMGDNRNKSTDSRKSEIGMVDERTIIGRVYCVIFPLEELGLVK